MKKQNKFLALIFQQGGTLRNICYAETKEQVENLMSVSYDFPFYAQYIPLEKLLNVSDMITIDNADDLLGDSLEDCELDLKVVGDFLAEDIVHQIEIKSSGETIKNAFGKEIKFDLNLFNAFKDLNTCKGCDGSGKQEIGPKCDKPASMCCGGCYEEFECDICEGAGVININL